MRVERSLATIPKPLVLALVMVLLFQVGSTWMIKENHSIAYKSLEQPKSEWVYRLMSLNSVSLMAHMLTLKLQLHDNQQGRHVRYKNISYQKLSEWLLMLQSLNKDSEYTTLLAARVFTNTPNKQQLKRILETVVKLFEVNPQKNWRWMAEGAVIAKYHLKDLNIALSMAKKIAQQPKAINIPMWARDLQFIILEEMNLLDSATYIVEQSLKDTKGMHPDERRFLKKRLSALKQKVSKNEQ